MAVCASSVTTYFHTHRDGLIYRASTRYVVAAAYYNRSTLVVVSSVDLAVHTAF